MGMQAAGGNIAGVDLEILAQREGTPLHVYSAPAIRQRIRALHAALQGLDAGICYAVKANGNGAVLRLLTEEGAGADIPVFTILFGAASEEQMKLLRLLRWPPGLPDARAA